MFCKQFVMFILESTIVLGDFLEFSREEIEIFK